MKKFKFSILLSLCLLLFGAQSAFAADPYESPANDTPSTAWILTQGTAYNFFAGSGDMDWYKFTTAKTATQNVFFAPPDTQSYTVAVYDAYQLDNSNGQSISPLAIKTVTSGPGTYTNLNWSATAGKSYYVLVYGGPNITSTYQLVITAQ
ncbi:hypothetical protein ACFPVX_11255 [Cohnella faecalis]|uniref:Peptidase C-terminal archaeal/bacterial domain-containing protein n=1 Tax=Cohnella faecalis TaxID=2315694 RepID=A0A398CPP6_9BACL|nr:hypothetical protein [Cohnella faecalis]RIE00934.1 hypothetical protein D3H35_25540 [Cohnella faecalis]